MEVITKYKGSWSLSFLILMKHIKKTDNRNKYFLVKSLFKIVDALVTLLSLGYYWSDFEYNYVKKTIS